MLFDFKYKKTSLFIFASFFCYFVGGLIYFFVVIYLNPLYVINVVKNANINVLIGQVGVMGQERSDWVILSILIVCTFSLQVEFQAEFFGIKVT
jgi:hypothetical protein